MRCSAASVPPRGLVRLARAAVAVLLALQLSGCITADGALGPDGTVKLTLTYLAAQGANEPMQRERLTAPGITIDSLSIAPDRKVTAVLHVTDLAAIGKTALLKDTTVTTGSEGDARTLTIASVVKPLPRQPEASVAGPSIRLTVPGTILDATEPGVVDGSTVKWAFRMREWLARPEWRLTVRYRPDQPQAPPAAKPG